MNTFLFSIRSTVPLNWNEGCGFGMRHETWMTSDEVLGDSTKILVEAGAEFVGRASQQKSPSFQAMTCKRFVGKTW